MNTPADGAPAPADAATVALRALLRALAHADVQALVLTTGELVQIERGERRAPLTQRPLGEAQIEALLAPTGLFVALGHHAGAQLEHPFSLDGRAYLAVAMRGAAGLRIRVVQRGAGPSAPQAATNVGPSAAQGAGEGPEGLLAVLTAGPSMAAARHPEGGAQVAAGAARDAPSGSVLGAPGVGGASEVAAAALAGSIAGGAEPGGEGQAPRRRVHATVAPPAGRVSVPVALPADNVARPSLRCPHRAVNVPAAGGQPGVATADTADSAPAPGRPVVGVAAGPASASAFASAAQPVRQGPDFGEGIPSAAELDANALASAEACLRSLVDARAAGASDVHLTYAQPPRWRRAGALAPVGAALPPAALAAFVASVLPDGLRARLSAAGYVDFAFSPPGAGRLRANLSRHSGGIKLCLRLLPDAPRTLEQLGLPPLLGAVAHFHQGLAVVSGPQGHGKSSTLAAIVDGINAARADHVVCIEDPIEVLFPRRRALISQREVGRDTRSFARAIKASLREDPDVIVIGELRDREAVEMALSAAETGHLVLTTMNTRSAAKTIDRLIDMFPPADQSQVRAALAGALKMVVSQRLLATTTGTRVAAAEVVTGCPPLSALIRDNKLVQLPTLQQRGAELGMLLLDQSLAELVRAGTVALPVALAASEQPAELQRRVAAFGPAGTPAGPKGR